MQSRTLASVRASRTQIIVACCALALAALEGNEPSWPTLSREHAESHAGALSLRRSTVDTKAPLGPEDQLVRDQPFCVASSMKSAGTLGEVVLYRYERHGDALDVGYFVYWSTERPWGDNELTRRVLPALAIDAVYSHLLFVLPGIQRVLYGPGDIEGALVHYRIEGDRLVAERARADDESHAPVRLSAREVSASDGSVVLLTEAWSHQLGGHDAARRAPGSERACFGGESLVPMTASVAKAFRLGTSEKPHRARPAWRSSVD